MGLAVPEPVRKANELEAKLAEFEAKSYDAPNLEKDLRAWFTSYDAAYEEAESGSPLEERLEALYDRYTALSRKFDAQKRAAEATAKA